MVNLYDIDDDWLEAIYKEVVFRGYTQYSGYTKIKLKIQYPPISLLKILLHQIAKVLLPLE